MEDEEPIVPRRPRGRRGRELERTAATGERATRRLALGAIFLAVVALGLTAWRVIAPGSSSCQSAAWSAAPAAADLPSGWSISATQYLVNELSITLSGPPPIDQTSSRAVIYVTVSCFVDDAAGSVTRSQAAAVAAGLTVASRSDLGEQGYTANASTGASFIQFRHGSVVTYVAASGDATPADVDAVASALDRAQGGNGSAAVIPTPAPSDNGTPQPTDVFGSAAPSPAASIAAPELEAALPTSVGGTALSINSAVGTDVLGNDPGSRAIAAALRAAGSSPDAFRAAQAYDPTGTIDLSITAFRVEGMAADRLQTIVIDGWLSAGGSGVKTTSTTISGRTVTQVDYGDGGTTPYIAISGDIVIIVESSSATLAAQAIAALPASN
jgi:hypothetical protein